MDADLTNKDRLSARFSFQRPSIFQAPIFGIAGGPAQGNFEGSGLQSTYSTGINYNRFFSNTLVAEFRVGVAWYHNEAHNSDFGTNTSETLGIPGVNLDPITSGIVGITINGGFSNPLIGYSASLPWIRAETNIDFANTWTKILGNHTVSLALTFAGFAMLCCRSRLLVHAVSILSTMARRRLTRVRAPPKPVLQTTSPAFCSMFQTRLDAIWPPFSRIIEHGNSSRSFRISG